MKTYIMMVGLSITLASSALAAPLIYRPMNPQISPGAYPSNEAVMNDIANLTKPKNTGKSSSQSLNPTELANQSALYTISSKTIEKLYAACPGGDPNCGGVEQIGTTTYTYVTNATAGTRTITIHTPGKEDTVIITSIP
ncbi:MAG: hypothetical protein EBR02_00995 [Alphaproteobacteria bacterium]|nr:hypothetical protein [Alphaproteobacteria bacterium]